MALPADGGLADPKPRSDFHTSPATLALLAGVPVLVSLWALLSPGLVLSHEMTWDFVYNLSGAWHLQHGHVAHVDFHEPVGQLNFMLTLLGFALVGPTPFAFLVGIAIVAAVVLRLGVVRDDAPPADSAGRPFRDLRQPARADAGQCRRQAERLLLRHVVQPLRLEPAQHPGADPVRAAARPRRRRLDRRRQRRPAARRAVLSQDDLLRRPASPSWASPS